MFFYKFLTFISIFVYTTVGAQTFKKLDIPDLKGGYHGFSSFVDFNNDGYLDIFVTGMDFNDDFNNAVLYENNGDLSFTESTISIIPRVVRGNHSWGDFDNNGTLDLLYTGTTSGNPDKGISKIYRNSGNGCDFVELPVALPGITAGSSDWVDIDNDGLLDIFLVGNDINNESRIAVFKNQGGDNFVEQIITSIDGISGGRGNYTRNRAKWNDLDGDGLKDLLLAQSTKSNFTLELYKNMGGFQFEKQNISLPKLSYVAMEIGDINKDGRPDIVFTGSPNLENYSGDGTGDFYVFTNNGNMNFTNSFTIIDEGVLYNDIELGDIDNDGFLDVANYGTGPWGTHPEITKIYRNNGDGSFSNFSHPLPDCRFGGIKFGDFDNDFDMDILYFGRIEDPSDNEITYVYENKLFDSVLPTEILGKETCICDNTLNFTLNNDSDSIQWNFGDPATGALNNSSDKKASHIFSGEATNYTISANFTKGAVTRTLTKVININELPSIAKPSNLTICANNANRQVDLNALKDVEILNGASRDDYEVFYFATYENAEENRYRLPIPFTIQNLNETIYVRVQSASNSKCYVLTDFQITFKDPPIANPVQDLFVCDDDYDGFATFDLKQVGSIVIGDQINMTIEYYDGQGTIIPENALIAYQNFTKGSETITARIIDTQTKCFAETPITLTVNSRPIANVLDVLIGCDEENDGISEYFDTSGIATAVMGNQSGMVVSYYDSNGNPLEDFSSPYTNTTAYEEIIVVRLTDSRTLCFAETTLTLKTSERPRVNTISDLFACGDGEGIASFDTSGIQSELIGTQKGLEVIFYDETGNVLNNIISSSFKNQTPFQQRIFVRVENKGNTSCYSETSFDLIVNTLPAIDLEKTYYLCDLTPSLGLRTSNDFDSYLWTFEDGSQISHAYEASIAKAGNYTLTVTKFINGINCEQTFAFSLIRSELPKITEIEYRDLSGNNYVKIITKGYGDFEYSLNGLTYFDSNVFEKVIGGTYIVHVRDKKGCGEDTAEVTLIDYPRYFTPNSDNIHDYWQIFGGKDYPKAMIVVFDRYGKIITRFSSLDKGWDGLYNGIQMPASDYWFKVNLGNGKIFNGHFTLKR